MTNRLIHEKSPYLQQHAHNPIAWYPWGDEAFQEALKEDKPVFLSIGYSTCHWCHVMAHESFSDPEIGQLMNDTFINIKIDREELPHVDALYMDMAQAIMASPAGWPLNLILTPDLKPFLAVTYLPKLSGQNSIGLKQLVEEVAKLWKSEDKERLLGQADQISAIMQEVSFSAVETLGGKEVLKNMMNDLVDLFDPIHGGVRSEPKFPLSFHLEFLMQYSLKFEDSRPLFLAHLTLEKMALGGIFDRVGGGFSRYAVDTCWKIPHFEKMLFDNALLISVYSMAYQISQKLLYKTVVTKTIDYLLSEMKDEQGGFYSAQDADTGGQEGLYYTFSYEELTSVLTPEQQGLFFSAYGITKEGNFHGRNVLAPILSSKEIAEITGLAENAIEGELTLCLESLFTLREKRSKPLRDDKIVASWNALLIDALCRASLAFQEVKYLEAATTAANFLKSELFTETAHYRRSFQQEKKHLAVLEDYVFYIKALLTLFEMTGSSSYLADAIHFTDLVEEKFSCPEKGCYVSSSKEEKLIFDRPSMLDDQGPAGTSVHIENLLRLYQITLNKKYQERAEFLLKFSENLLLAYPLASCYHALEYLRFVDKNKKRLIICLDDKQTLCAELKTFFAKNYQENSVIVWKNDPKLEQMLPYLKEYPSLPKSAIYVCDEKSCLAPCHTMEELERIL